jgi:outer membrane protein assembly factor BamA
MRTRIEAPAGIARALRSTLAVCAFATLGAATAAAAESTAVGAPAGPLAEVRWLGADALDSGALERATGWKRGRTLDAAAQAALVDGVARAYAELGHLAARVARVEVVPVQVGVRAEVTIEEGPRHRIGDVKVRGATVWPAGDVRLRLGWVEGAPWSEAVIERGLQGVVANYERAGRPYARASVRDLRLDGDRVHLSVSVWEGDSIVVDSALVEGAARTAESVTSRALRDLEGAPYDAMRAAEARRRLADLDVFTEVAAPRLELMAPGRARLVYPVTEAASSAFEGVVGWQGERGDVVGQARLRLDNLGGSARRAALGWDGRGSGHSSLRAYYREPFLFGWPVGAEMSIENERADTAYTRTDFVIGAVAALGDGLEAGFGWEAGRVVPGDGPITRSSRDGGRVTFLRRAEPFPDDGRPAPRWSLRLSTSQIRSRDRDTSGVERSAWLSSVAAEAEGWRPFGGRRVARVALESRLRLGEDDPVPLYDRYPLGGAARLRGYREEAFRTSRYGLLVFEAGWQWREARAFLFLDQALFRDDPSSASTYSARSRYRAGYGCGLALPTAIGRLGVDLGWGEGDGPLDAKLHLRLDSRF